MRLALLLCLAAASHMGWPAPVSAQRQPAEWKIEGLRQAFCVQLLLDPASEPLKDLPARYRPLPASEAKNLHPTLRGMVEDRGPFASWTPSRLCFLTADTIRTNEFLLSDKSGRTPRLFAYWCATATAPGGGAAEVVLGLFANSDRLLHSAREARYPVREAKVSVGRVPEVDENGTPSPDDRFQVRIGKTVITWDGRLAGEPAAVSAPVAIAWVTPALEGSGAKAGVALTPSGSRAMVGALKVEGKDELAASLRASPSRFAGPAYSGGAGTITLSR